MEEGWKERTCRVDDTERRVTTAASSADWGAFWARGFPADFAARRTAHGAASIDALYGLSPQGPRRSLTEAVHDIGSGIEQHTPGVRSIGDGVVEIAKGLRSTYAKAGVAVGGSVEAIITTAGLCGFGYVAVRVLVRPAVGWWGRPRHRGRLRPPSPT